MPSSLQPIARDDEQETGEESESRLGERNSEDTDAEPSDDDQTLDEIIESYSTPE